MTVIDIEFRYLDGDGNGEESGKLARDNSSLGGSL